MTPATTKATAVDYTDTALSGTVRGLDPLGADARCARLPEMNARGDVAALTGTLRSLTEDAVARADDLTGPAALAAVRDLGIVLGSLMRHDVEPCARVPEAVPVLRRLGALTDMVPRDTVLHYGPWNPRGVRERSYTDDPQETHLIESVRISYPALRVGLALGPELLHADPADPAFAPLVRTLGGHLEAMVRAMDLTVREVTPQFFGDVLRPYLEGVDVGGEQYLGPAAAQLPMWLVDTLLWAADRTTEEYAGFAATLVPYGLPQWRELAALWGDAPSLVTRVVAALEAADGTQAGPPPAVVDSADALVGALRTVVTFRGRHLGITRRVYEADAQQFTVGSGGGSVDLLRRILDLTKENARLSRPPARARRPAADHPTSSDLPHGAPGGAR